MDYGFLFEIGQFVKIILPGGVIPKGGTAGPAIVLERILQQCSGGIQRFYLVRPYMKQEGQPWIGAAVNPVKVYEKEIDRWDGVDPVDRTWTTNEAPAPAYATSQRRTKDEAVGALLEGYLSKVREALSKIGEEIRILRGEIAAQGVRLDDYQKALGEALEKGGEESDD